MDSDVSNRGGFVRADERVENRRSAALGRDSGRMRHGCKSESNRDRVAAWITSFEADRVVHRMRLDGVVIVCSGPVMVLRVIVVRVDVRVQSRRLAGECQGGAEQERKNTPHQPSVRNRAAAVKLPGQ